jgi:hypothetical protein
MSTTSQQIEEASLKAIEHLTQNISKGVQIENTLLSLDTFIDKCIQCCIVYLKDADLKLVWPSAKCLLAISSSTETAFILIARVLIKFLLEQYTDSNQINQKKIYLDLLNKFLTNGQKFSQTNACGYIVDSRDEILKVSFEIFHSNSLKQHLEAQALSLVECLVRYRNILKTIDCGSLIAQLWDKEMMTSDSQEQIIRIVLIIINEYDSLFETVCNSFENKLKSDRKLMLEILRLFSKLNKESSKLNLKLEALIRDFLSQNRGDLGLVLVLVDIYQNLIEFNQAYETVDENKEVFSRNLFNLLKFLLNEVNLIENLECIIKTSYLFQIYSSKLTSKRVYQDVYNVVSEKIDDLESFEVCF